MKYILNRDNKELIKKVYMAQKEDPTIGDFTKLAEKDLEMLGMAYEDLTSNTFSKQKLKISATSAAFNFLLNKKETHKKIKHIQYGTLKIQNY